MQTMPAAMITLFVVAVVSAFLFPFFKEKLYKQIVSPLQADLWKCYALFLAPFAVILGLMQYVQSEPVANLLYFLIAAVVPFALSRLRLPTSLIGLILFALSAACPLFVAHDLQQGSACLYVVAGLVLWKVAESLLVDWQDNLDDILPALTWLVGIYWINTALSADQIIAREGLLLGSLAIVFLVRLFQKPFLSDDRLFIKRFMLASTGGLATLIVIMKLMVSPALSAFALLIGLAMFFAYSLETAPCPGDEGYGLLEAVSQIAIIGIFTLAASRLFGNFGLIMLVPAMIVSTKNTLANMAGLFWISRALLQGFVLSCVPNVTGINITHPYAGAALYAGILLVLVASALINSMANRLWLGMFFVLGGTVLPLATNYFLHAEPSGSLLAASVVSSILIGSIMPVLQKSGRQTAVILLPLQMIAFALIGSDLIAQGNESTVYQRLMVFLYLAAALLALSIVLFWLSSASRRKSIQVSGN